MADLRSAPAPAPHAADHRRGTTSAEPLILYADFTCPRCALAYDRLTRNGNDADLILRHFALRSRPRALELAHAAEAAALQDAFWPFADSLFADQGHQDDPHLWARITTLGLDLEAFDRDRRGDATKARVATHTRGGLRAGVAATPAFVRGGVLTHDQDRLLR